MSDFAIKAQNLSKRYRIGLKEEIHDTLAGAFTSFIRNPLKNFRSLRNLSKFDNEKNPGDIIWALHDVSFKIKKGEVVGIIGRNGAGKSTLLKILTGITHPTTGRIELNGRVASLLEVGTGFHPELTGRENVYLNGTIMGMTRQEIDKKFDTIVDFSGVEKFIDTPVKRYSSGMRVRLAFSVAAHLDAEILLIDEVLAVGDVEFQKKCLGIMDDAAKSGRTILFVSHNLGAIRSLCPTSMLLDGNLIYSGVTSDVIDKYMSESLNTTNSPRLLFSEMEHSGSGEAKIMEAEITNLQQIHTLNFEMNETIQIGFKVNNPFELNLDYAIEILDINDYPLFHFLSEYERITVRQELNGKRSIQVKVNIPPLFLFPDTYFISIWVGMHNKRVDKVNKCFQIRIQKNIEIKRNFETNRGRFYNVGEWEVDFPEDLLN